MKRSSSSSSSDGSSRKIDRMVRETRALGDAVAEWLELRIALARAEVEEEVNRRLNQALRRIAVAAIAGMAGFFVLVTAALGLGRWLGHPVWGFAIVTGVLLVAAFAVAYAYPERKIFSLDQAVPEVGSGRADGVQASEEEVGSP